VIATSGLEGFLNARDRSEAPLGLGESALGFDLSLVNVFALLLDLGGKPIKLDLSGVQPLLFSLLGFPPSSDLGFPRPELRKKLIEQQLPRGMLVGGVRSRIPRRDIAFGDVELRAQRA
jgi:hypothetical protein